jgi:trigger factor
MKKHLKITQTENKKLKRGYEVVVEAPALETRIEAALKKAGAKAKIPGFRPGHVPLKVLRQRYGKSVMGEVIERTVNDAALEVTSSKDERPAMQPKIEITDYKEGGNLSFKIEYEVMPAMPKVDFSKISIEKLVTEATEQEIKEALGRIAESNRKLSSKAKTAKAALGDTVRIDFKGFIGKEAFPGGEAADFNLELGSGQFIPGFEDQLVGVKAGDKLDVNVPFPKEYHSADLAGKKAKFEVTVHEVLGAEIPKIDNEFAQSIGMDSLEKLTGIVRQQIQREYDSVSRTKMKKDLFDQLDAVATFDAPEGMVEMEVNSILSQFDEAKKRGEIDASRDEKELRAEYASIAERRVRLGIFLSNFASDNKIQVAKEELTAAVMEQARAYPGQSQKIFEFYQQHPESLQELRGPILEEKAVDLILKKVKSSEKKVSPEALLAAGEDEVAPKKKAASSKSASKAKKTTAEKAPATKTAAKKKA